MSLFERRVLEEYLLAGKKRFLMNMANSWKYQILTLLALQLSLQNYSRKGRYFQVYHEQSFGTYQDRTLVLHGQRRTGKTINFVSTFPMEG